MDTLLVFGILLVVGFVMGELGERLGFPRVTGYILTGVLLNIDAFHFVPITFLESTEPITNVALAILTFSIGGTLAWGPLRELGKGIAFIAVGEAELAAIVVTFGTLAVLPFLIHLNGAGFLVSYLPFALLLGALASPTDPSATLAVIHQYRAKGPVAFSIMGVAALDDALGIINFSVCIVLATILLNHATLQVFSLVQPFLVIGGSIALGVASGFAFHWICRISRNESEGLTLVVILAVLALCYGVATVLNMDQLLATMSAGVAVVNFGHGRARIFQLIEDYVEPLVFVFFFTVSGMYLSFSILWQFLPLVLVFVLFRAGGKLGGAFAGAALARTSRSVRRYTGWGLLPQGGIVIGLALIMRQNPALSSVSDILVSVTIGATVIHELIGPLTSKIALRKAGELPTESGRAP